MQSSEMRKQREPDVIDIRRNPYMVEYEEQRRPQENRRFVQSGRSVAAQGRTGEQPRRRKQETMDVIDSGALRSRAAQDRTAARRNSDRTLQVMPVERTRSRQAALKRRRKYIRRQRIAVGIFICCIVAAFYILVLRTGNAAAAGADRGNAAHSMSNKGQEQDVLIQGLPAVAFSAHPTWTEDFLTTNEYSRPGEPLPEVNSIFVHYTANPGTTAAQNRSYFEQQKDLHQASVSAHFIIGYEGEILQCIPMNEIAYAVQTRNYDSVSIECCYKAEDGSFTQETYDSLIALLVWLTDIYDLDTEDILRHYDCGGKRCPLYYTEHPDAWERLKNDVAKAKKTTQ